MSVLSLFGTRIYSLQFLGEDTSASDRNGVFTP